MSNFAYARSVGAAVAAAAVVSMVLASASPGPLQATATHAVQRQVVQLETALASVVVNTATADRPIAAADTAAVDDPAAIPRTIAGIALTAISLAASPLWYLAFPITLPLAASVMANSLGVWGGLGYAAGLVYSPVFWAAVPFLLGAALAQVIFPFPTATVTPAAATSRPHTGAEVSRPLRRTHVNPAAATPQRSAKPAAAAKKPKAAGAASKRRAVA